MRQKIGSRPTELTNSEAVSSLLGSSTFVALGFFADDGSAATEVRRRACMCTEGPVMRGM